jgi:prepilin-type N-terminal cleavage/methylation domain-containing protein
MLQSGDLRERNRSGTAIAPHSRGNESMRTVPHRVGRHGFSLIELLVVLAVLSLALFVTLPALQNLIVRNKLEGSARDLGAMIQRARMEAVRRSAPTQVSIDPVSGQVFAFADLNGPSAGDPPDGLFNPIAGSADGTTDFSLGRWQLPGRIVLAAPGSEAAVDGLTTIGGDHVARLLPDGSINDVGAFRLADQRGNFLEVRVEPKATARVTVNKWDGTNWWARGEGGHPWTWQ